MTTYKKGSFKIGLIPTTLILAAITLVFILLVTQSQQNIANTVVPSSTPQNTSEIKDTTDLDAAANQLDSVDPNTLDQNLNAVTSDNSAI